MARNYIRAALLQAGCRVCFQTGGPERICGEDNAAFEQGPALLTLLEQVDARSPASQALTEQLLRLCGWACPDGRAADRGALEALLEEVRRQTNYDSSAAPAADFEAFWREWAGTYPLPQTFDVIGKSVVNDVNHSEAADYLKAHEEAAKGVRSIDQAIDSLVATIPADVETILDVGSGTGYVGAHLPPDYSLLAIDIDEAILRENPRHSCVGDIMDLPLADRSMDLVMACDTLEHLPDDVLRKGIREMERVSRKYVYLQVPFQEDPLMGFAHCPACGNVWHVNHHKRTFDEAQLISILSADWKPILVNYTGDVSYRRSGLQASSIAKFAGQEICSPVGQICPKCGAQSAPLGEDAQRLLQRVVDYDGEALFPVYSEIGILFARNGIEPVLVQPNQPDGYSHRSKNALVFDGDLVKQPIYTGTELLPGLNCSGCDMQVLDGTLILRRSGEEMPWVAFSFPAACREAPRLVVRLWQSEAEEIQVSRLDGMNREYYVETWHPNALEGTASLSLSKQRTMEPVYVKLYFTADTLEIRDCRITCARDSVYRDYTHSGAACLSFERQGVGYRLYAPGGEHLFLSHAPEEWRDLTAGVYRRMCGTVSRFSRMLEEEYRAYVPGDNRIAMMEGWAPERGESDREKPDYRSLIADAWALESARAGCGRAETDHRSLIADALALENASAEYSRAETDHRSLIADALALETASGERYREETDHRSLIADSLALLEGILSPPAGVALAARDWGGREIITAALYAQAALGACRVSDAEHIKRRLRGKTIGILKRGKDKLHGWLRRHGRLYDALINIGLKDIYLKLKRRLKP